MFNTEKQIFYAVILGSIFFLILVSLIIRTAFLYYKRKREHLTEIHSFQNTLLQVKLETQEDTFKAISQEIHDNIGQMLTLSKLHLATLKGPLTHGDSENITAAHQLLVQSLASLRDLARTLNTDQITRQGLQNAIASQLQLLRNTRSWDVNFITEGDPEHLPPEKELILFRIVQESIQNIIKHASASQIGVFLGYQQRVLSLRVEDDGRGLVTAPQEMAGNGIVNMKNRAKAIGASLSIANRMEGGVTVSLELPY